MTGSGTVRMDDPRLDLRLDPGELVGVIGPNGAGKSTTIKMLTGMLGTEGPNEVVVLLDDIDRLDGASGQARACIITSGMSQSACTSVTCPPSTRKNSWNRMWVRCPVGGMSSQGRSKTPM